jgi:hypothetical protein
MARPEGQLAQVIVLVIVLSLVAAGQSESPGASMGERSQ